VLINNVMTLEQAWNILDSLNDRANHQSKDLWASEDIAKAVRYQSTCFKRNLLELDNNQQQFIQFWIEHDDEFQDYFKCLVGTE
jgi:hypothetical protein